MQSPNEPSYQAPIPEPTGYGATPGPYSGVNDSGTGPSARLPAELQGFNCPPNCRASTSARF